MTKQKQPDHEAAFRSSLARLPLGERLALLLRMRASLGKPEPVRVWVQVQEAGGCVVWANGEVGN